MNETYHSSRRGISLILVMILLVMIGIGVGAYVMRKDTEAVWNPRTGSQTNLEQLKQVLIDYQRTNHRLPCVAPRNVLPSAAGYGEELANCAAGAAATGGTVRLDIGGSVYVRIGAVPTKTLGLPEVAGEDEWKNRILYAVSEALTDPYQFTTGSGVMRVNDGAGAAKLTNAAFVILSHGADGKGAYGAKAASVSKVCAATSGIDQANCNDTDAVFADTVMETAAGAGFFDDIILWDRVDEVAQSMNRPCVVGTIGNATWGSGCTNTSWVNMLSGTGGQAVANTNTGTHVGNATLACDNGALVYSGESCFRHCTASTQSWSGGNCAGNVPLVNHTASSGTITNTNIGYTGDAVFSCTDGVLSVTSSNCVITPPPPVGDCAAQAVNWNTDCTGTAPLLTNGANTSVSNTAVGYSGSVTVTCSAGVLSQSGASCAPSVPPCAAPNCASVDPVTGNPTCVGDDTENVWASNCSRERCCGGILTTTNLSPACPGVDSTNSGVCMGPSGGCDGMGGCMDSCGECRGHGSPSVFVDAYVAGPGPNCHSYRCNAGTWVALGIPGSACLVCP